ncbi:hypothetical protein [Streptomyces paromomycinus]|uniref:Uncharacterized protein n=1 Tax=Streptomyces paromomycinus TaxID=92743 RepID=A0A401VZ85_STREY|nr:hypothetical protein [Streptomyces paromomycinus]GCD42331.1 hypothetical protein GKJPGBOP_01990 [Streptomyces paromomycinus]
MTLLPKEAPVGVEKILQDLADVSDEELSQLQELLEERSGPQASARRANTASPCEDTHAELQTYRQRAGTTWSGGRPPQPSPR